MQWGFYSGNIWFAAELLIAELIFLFPVPKRKLFFLRAGLCLVGTIAIAAFTPHIDVQVVSELFRFLFIFAITTIACGLCFDLKISMLVSMCTMGYAVQHMAYQFYRLIRHIPVFGEIPGPGGSLRFLSSIFCAVGQVFSTERLFELLIMLCVYVIVFFTYGWFSAKNECYKNADMRFNILSGITIFICVGITRFSRYFGETSNISTGIYSIVCCLLALFIQFNLHNLSMTTQEAKAIERVRREEKKQYEISKNIIDTINIKCHDLKHKISEYGGKLSADEVESLKSDISIYDSTVKTGNDAVDVLLTEKSIRCDTKGITLTCSGSCAALSFMKTSDIYSLFGNAVDNAIEAVEKLSSPEKKVIDISIEERGDFLFFNFTNYFEGELPLKDGLPQTTKTVEIGYHGFGMKSMKLIAEKYGGGLAVSVSKNIFNLNVYLAKSEKEQA